MKYEKLTILKIRDLIESDYKVGNDWVYEKGKSQEIKIIRALLESYEEVRDELLELMETRDET